MAKKSFFKNYGFILFMLTGIVAGCLVGALKPSLGSKLAPLGTVFINLMFCVVVPMVFCSIASAISNMSSAKRAGKVMGITIATFLVTAAIAAVIMYLVVRFFPVVTGDYKATEGTVDSTLGVADMIINFFTKPDFVELLSRKAILPLIIAAVFFGFGVQMSGGKESMVAKLLDNLTACLMNVVKIITYYAPIGFFGFFASLVATFGPDLIGDYSRTLIVYYVLSFVYMFVFFPIYARFGGGKGAVKVMWKHLFRPAAVSFGTCSSVATIPTNMEVCEETGVSKEVSNIVVPIGATMHMDGSAMSGIPGGGGTGELVLCTLFFPDQLAVAFPIALAIGNLVDPPATMVNSAGDYVATYIVSRFVEGKDWLQKKIGGSKEELATEE